jgi:hypothetical protein
MAHFLIMTYQRFRGERNQKKSIKSTRSVQQSTGLYLPSSIIVSFLRLYRPGAKSDRVGWGTRCLVSQFNGPIRPL